MNSDSKRDGGHLETWKKRGKVGFFPACGVCGNRETRVCIRVSVFSPLKGGVE